MGKTRDLADQAMAFLGALTLWEDRLVRMERQFHGRRAAGALTVEMGELRKATARLALSAGELAIPADPDIAREALRRLLIRLRQTGALPWSDAVAICNETADSVPPPRG